MMLPELLSRTKVLHGHLCPRQVLGVRMGMLAGKLLEMHLPQVDKRLIAFVETDGCFADGVSVATGCWLGRRTMRLMDYGKVAATFVDTLTMEAVRIHPHRDSRQRAIAHLPDAESRWHAQLEAYQVLPDDDLLIAKFVTLSLDLEGLISRPGYRVICDGCGEEIINEREVMQGDKTLCRSCVGEGYYQETKKPSDR